MTVMKVALEVRNLWKSIQQDTILKCVNFTLQCGEIHLIWGENGAGKSILMRIICGILPFDKGEVEIFNHIYEHKTPDPSESSVIAFFSQENSLINRLSVFDNLFLSDPFCLKKHTDYFMDRIPKQYFSFCSCLMPLLEEKAANISPSQAQILQIMKTVLMNRSILIFDEPTSYLNDYERMQFFNILKDLKKQGKSIIVISHVANKFKQIGDNLSIIKDGTIIKTQSLKTTSEDHLISRYVDPSQSFSFPKLPIKQGNIVFEANSLTTKHLENISFKLHAGEIIGFTGSTCSGQEELCKSLCGFFKPQYGYIKINGHRIIQFDPEHMLQAGFYAFPSSKDNSGIFENKDISFNIAGINHSASHTEIQALSNHYIRKLHIKTTDSHASARHLSFGNKKKVLLARSLINHSTIYCFDNPTAGVDAIGISEFYNIINHLLQKGVAVILISSNFTELTSLCDTIYFIKSGKVYHTLTKTTPETLYDMCSE